MTQDDAQQAIEWTQTTGLPLLRPTDTKEELEQLWEAWRGLSKEDQARSDEQSI